MAGIYKIGFRDGDTSETDALEEAVRMIRDGDGHTPGDDDPVTAGPEVIRTAAHEEAGEFLVRVVTGVTDPLAVRPREGGPEASADFPAHTTLARLADLPDAKVAQLAQILDLLEAK